MGQGIAARDLMVLLILTKKLTCFVKCSKPLFPARVEEWHSCQPKLWSDFSQLIRSRSGSMLTNETSLPSMVQLLVAAALCQHWFKILSFKKIRDWLKVNISVFAAKVQFHQKFRSPGKCSPRRVRTFLQRTKRSFFFKSSSPSDSKHETKRQKAWQLLLCRHYLELDYFHSKTGFMTWPASKLFTKWCSYDDWSWQMQTKLCTALEAW